MENLSKESFPQNSVNEAWSAPKSYFKMEEILHGMRDRSRFKRLAGQNTNEEYLESSEGELFKQRKIISPDDPAIQKIYDFRKKYFSADEAGSLETVKSAIKEGWIFDIIEDENGNIISYLSSIYTSSEKDNQKYGSLFLGFIATDKHSQKRGFGEELLFNSYVYALENARSQNEIIQGIIGECVNESEIFFNKMGYKRIYFTSDHGDIQEVPYQCAPNDWNKNTGEPLLKPVSEHLMLRLISGANSTKTDELTQMIKPAYEKCYIFPKEFFDNQDAFENNKKSVTRQFEDLDKELRRAQGDELLLMSADEREQKQIELQPNNKKIIEI
jgi:hypothetical protein